MTCELWIYFLNNPKEKIPCESENEAVKKTKEFLKDGFEKKEGKKRIFYPSRLIEKIEIRKMIKRIIVSENREVTALAENKERLPEYEGNIEDKIEEILEATEGKVNVLYLIEEADGGHSISREEFTKRFKREGEVEVL